MKSDKIKLKKGKSKVFIIANLTRETVIPCTKELIDFLAPYKIKIYIDEQAKNIIGGNYAEFVKRENVINDVDIVFVVGGDGTILRAVKKIIQYDKPILGINAGRLGFLSNIEGEDICTIKKLFTEGCRVEKRNVFDVKIKDKTVYAVNDVYVTKTEPGKISELFVECDEREVCRYRADGILVATPNGSTAYSMSAGGPILDTNLNAIIMTPVCPHSLISCSIVFSPEKVISIGSSFNGGEKELDIVVDGEIVGKLKKGEKVNVMISEKNAGFVNLSDRGFYEVLNQKIIERR